MRDGSVDIGFVNLPSPLDCECIPLMEDRLMAILPKDSRFASYPKFPLVECETEPFISLLKSSDHDARRALEAAGVTPNVRFYTKDDYAVIAMVEQGLGISIMPELLLKGLALLYQLNAPQHERHHEPRSDGERRRPRPTGRRPYNNGSSPRRRNNRRPRRDDEAKAG